MKRLILNILILLTAVPAFSQDWEAIKNNPQYLYGEGWGVTLAEADKQALNDLISKITVQVQGTTTTTENETNSNGNIDSQTGFSSVVKTYSQGTLNNTEKVILQNEPDAHVGRYIRRSEIAKIFESRKNKIKDYVQSAEKAEKSGKIDVALKDYYWALVLLQSLQYPNELKYETEEGDNVVLANWIPHQMNDIFGNLKVGATNRDGDDVELLITYKGIPVNAVDYTYFDGRDWGNIYSAKDGVGLIELAPGNQTTNYQVKFEYEYRGESHIDKDVEAVIEAINPIPMRNAYQNFKGTTAQRPAQQTSVAQNNVMSEKRETNVIATFTQVPEQIYKKPEEFKPDENTFHIIERIIDSVVSKKYDNVKQYFTPYAYDIYERLLKYGNAKVVGDREVTFYKNNGVIYARGLHLAFSFKTGTRKSFVEDIVFTFNDEGLIDNLSFGLGKTAEDDILGKGVWNENARFAIINFLENYQTAYALKRLDYIETIFDDDAVIITGSVVHKKGKRHSGDVKGIEFDNDIIKYNRFTKDSYLQHLKKGFATKEFINIRFNDNEIRKLGKGGEVYAIQINQEYYSPHYGDKGYLFLMVDMNDPENPIIKVRTWQPEKDPNFGVYGPEDFM
ncbi:MAG: LPP20 family lipoprotein [Muribaculaceae bacterium]|nr:LPP20 family lipoprotein [Muribaculaceae bacterium]